MKPIPVLLVDDNSTFVEILRGFIQEHYRDEVTVVGTANEAEQGLAYARALRPEAVLLDLAMPNLPGLKAIPRLRRILPEAGIIALTLLDPANYRQAALEAGADEFVCKATLTTDLLPAIRRVARGGASRHTPGDVSAPKGPEADVM